MRAQTTKVWFRGMNISLKQVLEFYFQGLSQVEPNVRLLSASKEVSGKKVPNVENQ